MYLNSSQDILNLSLAISVFGLACLIGWILIYFLLIIRRLVKILQGLEESMQKVSEFVSVAKAKLENSASYLSILATGARDLVSYFMTKRQTKSSKKK
jgi:hypothetical protein